MKNTVVRLEGISIKNFKNIKNAQLSFVNKRKAYKTSILGLYGQNGSGKTALIDAVELLQFALKGEQIPDKFADYINIEAESAEFCYEFIVSHEEEKYKAFYSFKLFKLNAEEIRPTQNMAVSSEGISSEESKYKAVITEEKLDYSYENRTAKIRKNTLINTASPKVFSPFEKYSCLAGNDKNTAMDLMIEKKRSWTESRSFIFSRHVLDSFRKNQSGKSDVKYLRHMCLIESLVRYGNIELFVIHAANFGFISMNLLPLSFKYEEGANGAAGSILIPLDKAAPIPEVFIKTAEHVLNNMNVVLSQIVPGLTISMERLGETVDAKGIKKVSIQLMSLKNKKSIPLKYESDGIKKIISVLQLLIFVYNHPSITVAVDELDSGVFEYLLGELLRIISEKGKGQLLFTSHNLRPLETLDRGFIAFTTTNPCNRYIRMSNLKENNNLRDFYFRDIILGEQSEEVYAPTNNAEIALSFKEAGEFNDA